MAILSNDARMLRQKFGNTCAFPGCGGVLIHSASPPDDSVLLSDIAHIVACSANGPGGVAPLPSDDRDRYDNLILLCQEHHRVVEAQLETYTVERLHEMAEAHESLVLQATGRALRPRVRASRLLSGRCEA